MTRSDFEELLKRLANSWTNRDYDAVATSFSENVFYSDSLNYAIRDRDSLLAFFRDDDGKPQSCVFHGHVFDEDRQIGVAEYSYEGTFRYHGTVWVELNEGKIVGWREYQHRSAKDWVEFWHGTKDCSS